MSVSNASNVSGAKEPPLRSQTVDAALRDAARQWPHRPALICRHQQRRYTYAQLDAEVDRVARGFVQLGLRPQERLGIWSPNNAFKSSDYIGMMAELLPEIAGSQRGGLRAAPLPELRLLIQIGGGDTAGYFSFADIVALGDAATTQPAAEYVRNEDAHLPYNIQFTSGTTGLPKGVTLTHFNLVNNGFFVGEGMRLTEQDSVCVPVPLYHCFGMVLGVLAAITHGSALVFPNDGFDAEKVLEAVVAERCTALYGVPTMFIAELEHPRFHARKKAREQQSGAAHGCHN
jgi:fatty-acyl-CoA synthase